MKKLAIVASSWHYPLHFYETMANQALPEGWKADMFAVSHRDPKYAKPEVKKYLKGLGEVLREDLDRKLYEKVASKTDIKKLGWTYIEKPNTIGDWGNVNQWLEDYDYKDYDVLLFTHDDNLIINPTTIYSVLVSEEPWDVITNSVGMPPGSLRGSFEFFKKETLEKIGGKFDMSEVKLDRTGETKTPDGLNDLADWNATIYPLTRKIAELGLKVSALSPCYRMSMFCIEGERGFISKTHGLNTPYEEQGLKVLKDNNLI